MKTLMIILILIALFAFLTMAASGCAPQRTSSDVQRERQETLIQEGVAQVGMPAIKNFRELKIVKDLYELRDQTGLTTYTYLWNEYNGKLVFVCDSIGYAIPYATQYSAPESVQRYYIPASGGAVRQYGVEPLPQAEPNGLFSPASAEGSWVMCKDPGSENVRPVYLEPRVVVSQFKMPCEIVMNCPNR
jgi:hypothetical protein